MNPEWLQQHLAEIQAEAVSKSSQALKAFCDANSTVKVGDYVANASGDRILVERISYTVGELHFRPECVYHGRRATRNFEVWKDGNTFAMRQHAVAEHIPKERLDRLVNKK